jgi:hypothetical protein
MSGYFILPEDLTPEVYEARFPEHAKAKVVIRASNSRSRAARGRGITSFSSASIRLTILFICSHSQHLSRCRNPASGVTPGVVPDRSICDSWSNLGRQSVGLAERSRRVQGGRPARMESRRRVDIVSM